MTHEAPTDLRYGVYFEAQLPWLVKEMEEKP